MSLGVKRNNPVFWIASGFSPRNNNLFSAFTMDKNLFLKINEIR